MQEQEQELDEVGGIHVTDHIVIKDLDTDEILVAQQGSMKKLPTGEDE